MFSLVTIIFWYRLRLRSEVAAELGADLLGTSDGALVSTTSSR
jgi:hypothetical protein